MTLAGLKKWVPMTWPGREVACAIRSTSSVEVLVARIAVGLQRRSSRPKTSCLTAISSNTASTTMSASATTSQARVPRISASRCSISAGARRPFSTVAA